MLGRKIASLFALMIVVSTLAAASPAELSIFPKESSTEINSFTSYEVEVENVGPVKDVYSLSSTAPEVTIAPREVELEPGAEETVHVWYNPAVSKEEGTYTFTVTAASRATGKRFSVDGRVNVLKDHKVDVAIQPASRTACLGKKAVYNVEVTNNGIQKEEFSLSTDRGKLTRKKVSLEEGETQQVRLEVSSGEPVQKNFNVVAASTTSYAKDIENVEFRAETCFASRVSATPETQDVAAFTGAQYEVTVSNTGTRADEFVLSATRGELEDTRMTINGKSSETTTLTLSPEKLGKQTVTVTAQSTVESSDQVVANVFNGMDASVSFQQSSRKVCEDQDLSFQASIKNTGAATESYSLATSRGNLTDTEVELEPGESTNVNVNLDSSKFETGSYNVRLTATPQTFGRPKKSSSTSFTVENCWDLSMKVVPKVASAGKNRSVVYEMRLENTGTRRNSYNLSHNGPAWISVKPGSVEVEPGQTGKAFMYAGIPFQKKGEVKITVTGIGKQVSKSRTVRLLIDEEIKDAIESPDTRTVTGRIRQALADVSRQIKNTGNATRIALAVLAGLIITAAVLIREL